MGNNLIERWSPEAALNNAFADMKKSGLEGLKKHLTANALKTVNRVEAISNMSEVSLFSKALLGKNPEIAMLDKLSECDWSIKEMMKGSKTTKAIVAFNHQDTKKGTMELTMIKEDKIWKIDSLSMPKFEKCTLVKGNPDQVA